MKKEREKIRYVLRSELSKLYGYLPSKPAMKHILDRIMRVFNGSDSIMKNKITTKPIEKKIEKIYILKKECISCKREFLPGRSNTKYCAFCADRSYLKKRKNNENYTQL